MTVKINHIATDVLLGDGIIAEWHLDREISVRARVSSERLNITELCGHAGLTGTITPVHWVPATIRNHTVSHSEREIMKWFSRRQLFPINLSCQCFTLILLKVKLKCWQKVSCARDVYKRTVHRLSMFTERRFVISKETCNEDYFY